MLKGSVAVLDIGSSKVTAIVGERGVNNTFAIKGMCDQYYDGFGEGKFYDVPGFEYAVKSAVEYVSKNVRADISTLYVGVPGSFVRLETRKYKIAFKGKKRIREADIEDLLESGSELAKVPDYRIIFKSAINYALDDERKVTSPVGYVSTMLGGHLSYILCSEYFIATVDAALAKIGVKDVKYVYDGYAEGMFLIDDERRETPTLIIDVGYITTASSVVWGGGVIAKDTFDFGGGHITAALLDKFDLSLDVAESLKRSVNLGFAASDYYSTYRIYTVDGLREFSTTEVNEKVIECLDEIAGNIDSFLEELTAKVNKQVKVYITGGGISYMRGAKEHISGRLAIPIDILRPTSPQYNKAGEASKISLLDYALKDNAKKKRFLFFK